MKIRPVGVQLFYAEGQTYMTKLTVVFHNTAEAPKTCDVVAQYIPGNV